MDELDLSIIILNWNTKKLLMNCLDSVFKYTKAVDFEVIVCDNGSSDQSMNAVKHKYGSRVMLIYNEDNLGFARGNNPGLDKARGRYLLLLNSDTLVTYDVLSNMVFWMDNHTKIGICGPKRLNKDGSLQMNGIGNLPGLMSVLFNLVLPFHKILGLNEFLPALHKGNSSYYSTTHQVGWVTGSCFLIRRKVYEQIGGLDENIFMYVEETEYCKRASDSGWVIWYLGNEFIYHLERGSSVSGRERAVIGVYQGLKYYFSIHHSKLKTNIIIWMLKVGAILRLPINFETYIRAFKSV